VATILHIGTDEGVVTVRGGGSSWEADRPALRDWEVQSVSVRPEAPNVVFAGTRGDGVWRSDDAGKSWSKPSYGRRGPGKVRCITADPADPSTLYAGTEPIDIFVSHDSGATWECLDSVWDVPFVSTIGYPVAVVEPHVRDIAIDPTNPKVMYAALQVGYMVKSTDGGATWKMLDKQVDADVHTIRLNPQDPSRVMVATGGHDYRLGKAPGKALYRSYDGGESWQPTGASLPQEYSVPLAIHPSKPLVAFAGLANGTPGAWRRPTGAEGAIVRTADGGDSWQEVATDVPDGSQRMAIGIAFDPAEPAHVYAAMSDGHVLSSRDGGDSWAQLEVRTARPNHLQCVRD
jgi:photosystem II stability/assembly factor-like uncharacterized protein